MGRIQFSLRTVLAAVAVAAIGAAFWVADPSSPFRSFAPISLHICVLAHWLLIRPPQGPKD